jgi:dUTP pyrophosphatase
MTNRTSFHLPVAVHFNLTHPDAKLPTKQHTDDAGYDLTSVEDVTIVPRELPVAVSLGLSISVSEVPHHHFFKIESRSGLALKGISAIGGIVDSSYRGEIKVLLVNHGPNPVTLPKGTRVAQLVVYPIVRMKSVVTTEVTTTDRGMGGFGSTGS